MKKILITASNSSHIINFHTEYIDYLTQKGYVVDTATNGKVIYKNVKNSFNINYCKNIFSVHNIFAIFKLAFILRKNKYDLFCTNSMLAGAVGRLAKFLSFRKTKVLHISHGYLFNDDSSKKSKLFIFIEKFLKNFTNSLIVMNEMDFCIAKKYKLSKNINFTNGMGVNISTLSEKSLDVIYDNGDLQYGLIFCCVGEFSSRKNQKFLIENFYRLQKVYCNIKLLLAGEGATKKECEMIVKHYNLEDKVIFLGHINDIQNIYYSSDITISTSFFEGLPFNIMESLYYKTPIIVSGVKGNVDLCDNYKNGLIFEFNDSDNTLYSAMEKVIVDKELYNNMVNNTYLDSKYHIENVKPIICSIYDSLLEENING